MPPAPIAGAWVRHTIAKDNDWAHRKYRRQFTDFPSLFNGRESILI
jgi:hypothetical protein